MNLSTQIGGNTQSSIITLRDMLVQQDIKVAHPAQDELNFSSVGEAWTEYEKQLAFFESIAMSSFHIICNQDGVIDNTLALQILYAMVKQKPIFLQEAPRFDSSVTAFTRETIANHLKQVTVVELSDMQPAEINYLLKSADTHCNFQLTPHEEALIKSNVKAYFRSLLEDAKKALLLQPAQAIA